MTPSSESSDAARAADGLASRATLISSNLPPYNIASQFTLMAGAPAVVSCLTSFEILNRLRKLSDVLS